MTNPVTSFQITIKVLYPSAYFSRLVASEGIDIRKSSLSDN